MHVKTKAEWLADRDDITTAARDFAAALERRPFQNEAGLRGVSAFALYWFLHRVRPSLVLEVGVWRGFSTWIIEQALPDAEIWSFDPLFFFGGEPAPTYRTPRARYFREDFSCADLRSSVAAHREVVAFFDDHHRQLARVEQARRVGIEHLIFDDNPPLPYSNRTLEDERRDVNGRAHLEALLDRYEVFPALWDVDDAHEYAVREEGLGIALSPDLAYLHSERKWHSYVTYVHATRAAPAELNRSTAGPDDGAHLHPVAVASRPAPTPAVQFAAADETSALIARMASLTSNALGNLEGRVSALEAVARGRVPVGR